MSARDLVDYVEQHTELDVIAITDHDETSASLEAREWAARRGYRVQVVPGVEVTTREGHLLALFVEERPPALRAAAGDRRVGAGPRRAVHRAAPVHPLDALPQLPGARTWPSSTDCWRASKCSMPAWPAAPRGRRAVRFVAAASAWPASARRTPTWCRWSAWRGRASPAARHSDLRRAIEAAATSAEGRFATPGEMASEAIPQLARSMVHLPLRRIVRFARARRRAHRQPSELLGANSELRKPCAKIRPT